MIPKVDTFEGDISYEIKRKEASLTEISAASNNIGNNDDIVLPKKTPVFLITLVIFFILCVIGIGSLAYFYLNDSILSPTAEDTRILQSAIPKNKADLKSISPTLSNEIGRFVTGIEKRDQGYIITIREYSPVFAYMTRNENNYIGELVLLFGENVPIPQAPPIISTSTTIQATTTLIAATSTIATATTTTVKIVPKKNIPKAATSTKPLPVIPLEQTSTTTTPEVLVPREVTDPYFTDVTISNQNMRVWASGGHMIVYAFVGNNTVLISNTKEGILNLKSAILR